MKKFLLAIFIFSFVRSQSQIEVRIDSAYFQNHQLWYSVSLVNLSRQDVAIYIDKSNYANELPEPITGKQLEQTVKSTFPHTFVVYYYHDTIIDEFVSWGHWQSETDLIDIEACGSLSKQYRNSKVGETVRRLVNKGESIYAEFYIVYKLNEEIKFAKSKRMKVKF